MNARAREADDDVPSANRPTVDDLGLPDDAEARAREVQIPHDFRHDGDLSPDDRDVGERGTAVQADADLAGDLSVVVLDGDVVDESKPLRADAAHVGHDHPDAIGP